MSEQLLAALKALADKNRLELISLLMQHDLCVRALARRLSISEAAVSQHLQVLKLAGLVVGERRGYYVHHQVQRETILRLANQLGDLATAQTRRPEGQCVAGSGRCAGECHGAEPVSDQGDRDSGPRDPA